MYNYRQTVKELFGLQQFAIKLGLDNITALCDRLNQPHKKYPVIHLAGTNGKGSSAWFIARILDALGLKVGLYTSPHLVDFRERIRVGDQLISEQFVCDFWSRHKQWVLERKATFFDTTTALAFDYFSEQKVDVAVIETGLGGRLDSTNIVQPYLAVITNIGYDHQKQLGNTLTQIAGEKAGIIKPGAVVVCAGQEPEVHRLIMEKAQKNPFHYIPQVCHWQVQETSLDGTRFSLEIRQNETTDQYELQTRQNGEYQAANIALALFCTQLYAKQMRLSFTKQKAVDCISDTIWPGRLQIWQKDPNIILDVSHNLDGVKTTITSLERFPEWKQGSKNLLLGLVNDKDAEKICRFLGNRFDTIVVTEPATGRRQESSLLKMHLDSYNQNVKNIKDSVAAFEWIRSELSPRDNLLIMGSHYLVGEILNHLT